jgi:hypothetical protein
MFEQGEEAVVAMATIYLEGALRDIGKASQGGLDHDKFGPI